MKYKKNQINLKLIDNLLKGVQIYLFSMKKVKKKQSQKKYCKKNLLKQMNQIFKYQNQKIQKFFMMTAIFRQLQ